jgi:hypothetical protein
MARKEYFPNIRRTKRKEEQIARIAHTIGVEEDDFAAVFDFALAVAVLVSDKLDQDTLKRLITS